MKMRLGYLPQSLRRLMLWSFHILFEDFIHARIGARPLGPIGLRPEGVVDSPVECGVMAGVPLIYFAFTYVDRLVRPSRLNRIERETRS